MKTKLMIKLTSLALTFAMVFGLIPASALTAFAAEPTEITEIKSVIAADRVPKAGMEVDLFIPNVPDGEPYSRPWWGADWYDSQGVKIAPTVNHHYDLGYEFEAGHTYYADYQYTASDGYVFAQNPTITLTGPDPSMFTYEIIDRWDNNESVTVRYTFTIPGDYENADINKVSMQYYGTPKDGGKKPDRCKVIYNNCTITYEEWNTGTWGSDANWGVYAEDGSNAPTFLAGNTYVHMIELTAKDGYKFSAGLHVQKGTQDAEEYGVVTLSDDRTVATVKFTYEIPSVEIINTIELRAASQHMNFCLRSGESIYLPQPFVPKYVFSADCPYKVENVNSCDWINDETGKYLELGYPHTFENAKKYTLRFHVRIKDEFETTHKFASGTDLGLNVTDYAYANSSFVDFKVSGGGTTATVEVTFTVQFPEGAGSSAGNPAYCYSYEEFKYAMESPDIRFVALGNVDDIITKVEGDGLIPAISVNGIKHLNVIGNATFTAPASDNGYKTICALLHTTQGDTLTVSGAGKLKFRAVANNSYNAVIYNQGGSVIIDSNGALIGSYNTAVYGKAIWQEYGELRISGGQFFAENALAPGSLPQSHSAVYINGGQAWIQGGTFKTESHIDTIDLHYGLDIGQYATVDLSGGTFYGILLPKSSTPLANYMDEETYTPLSNESWFNPESEYSQEYVESGKVVRIAWLIDHVDIHINAPIAGVDITENYFNIPTSGCEVTMYYPQWYKNGEPVTYGTFEAGASYKVVVWVDAKADYGAEFKKGVTVAINNQSVAVDRKSSHLIAVEYDFGECPNIVPQVDLTITAPKEGETIRYTVGSAQDTYYAVGGSSNYTDYRAWYESDTGYDNWRLMSPGETFTSGKYYKLYVDIRTKNGYEFPLIDNGTIQPNVSATVNGHYANVIKAYEQDPSRYITVEYNFGECNDSVVENIIIENVTAPVAGEKPNYNWSIRGSGYQMNTAKNAYEDIYWKNPPEKWYYIKNGIGWFDRTKGDWIYENETFIHGHEYRCIVYVVAENGFEFVIDLYTNPETWPTATVNGYTAEIDRDWTNATEARVYYTFTCKQPEINTIILYNLDEPQAGKTPDTEVTAAYPEYYTVTNVTWLDEEDGVVNSVEQGRLYTAEITVAAKDYDGVDGCIFANDVTAYIDGTEVTGWSNTVTVNNDNTLTVRYGFRKPASAPIAIPYAFLTQPVGGTVYEGQTHTAYWQTSFIPTDTEIQYWDGEAWDQWNIQQAQAAVDSYDFVNVDAGSYRFRIVAYIGNDAVATSNEFVITWTEVQNDYTLGDINDDDAVDKNDAIYLLYSVLFGESQYPLNQSCDFNADGSVDKNDAIYLLYHALFGAASYPLN